MNLTSSVLCLFVSGGWPENTTQPEIAIVTAPHHVIVEKKSPLLLNCSVVTIETFGPLEFRWKKNGELLDLDRRIQVFQNGSLYFRRIVHRKRRENRLTDEGLYECVAGNGKGRVVARRVRVEVAGKSLVLSFLCFYLFCHRSQLLVLLLIIYLYHLFQFGHCLTHGWLAPQWGLTKVRTGLLFPSIISGIVASKNGVF